MFYWKRIPHWKWRFDFVSSLSRCPKTKMMFFLLVLANRKMATFFVLVLIGYFAPIFSNTPIVFDHISKCALFEFQVHFDWFFGNCSCLLYQLFVIFPFSTILWKRYQIQFSYYRVENPVMVHRWIHTFRKLSICHLKA